jgi:hypothetical protein
MKLRLAVFAHAEGWVVASQSQMERFADRAEAMQAARQRAGVARWRGAEVELLAQDAPGGALAAAPGPWRS